VDAPAWNDATPLSVLGGTGVAVSALSADASEAARWLAAFLADRVQTELVPAHCGQPAHRAVWSAGPVDAAANGYYTATRATVEAAWIRPRIDGWIQVQEQAGELVREAVIGDAGAAATVAEVNRLFAALAGSTSG
jgi:multiple sugar transport system substrate-binding protein